MVPKMLTSCLPGLPRDPSTVPKARQKNITPRVFVPGLDNSGPLVPPVGDAFCDIGGVVRPLHLLVAGDGRDGLLAFPTGRALARLTVQCLAAALANRDAPPYLETPGRSWALESLAGSRPSKMRRGNAGEARPVVETAAPQEELVDQAHQGLFHLLSSIGQEPVLTPKLEFLASLLEEAVVGGKEQARAVLQPLPPALLSQVVKVQPERFTLQMVSKMFDNSVQTGRKTTAR